MRAATSPVTLEDTGPAERRPVVCRGPTLCWRGFRSKCKGSDFEACPPALHQAPCMVMLVEGGPGISDFPSRKTSLGIQVAFPDVRPCGGWSGSDSVSEPEALPLTCPRPSSPQPYSQIPSHFFFFCNSFSALQENSSRKSEGQRERWGNGRNGVKVCCVQSHM